ncbi:MAG: lipopolysaccharide transport periplasmic protein LptA [Pontibacterium sp.]
MNRIVKVAALLFVCNFAWALPDDRDQPMYISADNATIDEISGITTYTGTVKITQGSMSLASDKAVIYTTEGDIERVEAFGQPAHMRQQPQIDKPFTDAWGNHVIYNLQTEKATLLKDAKVISDNNTFTGARILYNLKTSFVEAFSDPAEKKQRVQMIILPKKKSN